MSKRATQLVRLALVGSLILTGIGCSGSTMPLVGQWDMIPAGELAEVLGEGANPQPELLRDARKLGRVSQSDGLGQMTLVFEESGALQTQTSLSTKRGSWRLVSQEGDRYQLECELKGETTITSVTMMGPDTIRLVPPNVAVLDSELVFRRRGSEKR